jgi:dihydroneopterin aldolase
MKDIIYIKDLRVKTIIGIFDWERKVKQEVSIDLEFPFDCKKAAATDSIEDTVDYKSIAKGVIKFVEESSFQLQETLAEGIASLVKDEYGVESIKLRVSKPWRHKGLKRCWLNSSIDNAIFFIARKQY